MLELFRAEAENQTSLLTNGLLALEREPATAETFESLMRASHSLKGAARIVGFSGAVRVAHALEDCFVAAQAGQVRFARSHVDLLLRGVDLLAQLAKRTEATLKEWETENQVAIDAWLSDLGPLRHWPQKPAKVVPDAAISRASSVGFAEPPGYTAPPAAETGQAIQVTQAREHLAPVVPTEPERVLRLGAGNLNRLLALAGESLVESRWLRPFADSLEQLKRHHASLDRQLDRLRQCLRAELASEQAHGYVKQLTLEVSQAQQFLVERIQDLDVFDRRSAQLSQRLYLEVLRTRMRPFGEGVRRFPRMVRDLARSLAKEINFEVSGENTQVDRDILERLETPLAHLIRNAVDHGCESAEERRGAGKVEAGTVRLEARHSAGVLLVTVSDDGR
ncbi:MAG TPA: Hpt domain-containing protein, partial [Verrucomicrobiae bacterium]|nr:Hpt domain-containing protein [Verrucomicrobiae bacterium]